MQGAGSPGSTGNQGSSCRLDCVEHVHLEPPCSRTYNLYFLFYDLIAAANPDILPATKLIAGNHPLHITLA
jgi:hypothetical protein